MAVSIEIKKKTRTGLLSVLFLLLSVSWALPAKASLDPLISQLIIPQVALLYDFGFAGSTPILSIPLKRRDGSHIELLGFPRLRNLEGQLRINLCKNPERSGEYVCNPFSGTGYIGAYSPLGLVYENGELVAKINLQGVSPNDLFRVWISSWDGRNAGFLSRSQTLSSQFVADIQTLKHLLSFPAAADGYETGNGIFLTRLLGTQNMEATQLRRITPHLFVKFCGNGNCDKYCTLSSPWNVGCSLMGESDYRDVSVRLVIGPISAGNTQSDPWAGVEYGPWIIAQSIVIPAVVNPPTVVNNPPPPPPPPPDAVAVGPGVQVQPPSTNVGGTVQGGLQQIGPGAVQVIGGNVAPENPPPENPLPNNPDNPDNPVPPLPPDVGDNALPPVGGGDIVPPQPPDNPQQPGAPEPIPQPGTGQGQGGGAPAPAGGGSSGCSLQASIPSGNAMDWCLGIFPLFLALLFLRRSKQL